MCVSDDSPVSGASSDKCTAELDPLSRAGARAGLSVRIRPSCATFAVNAINRFAMVLKSGESKRRGRRWTRRGCPPGSQWGQLSGAANRPTQEFDLLAPMRPRRTGTGNSIADRRRSDGLVGEAVLLKQAWRLRAAKVHACSRSSRASSLSRPLTSLPSRISAARSRLS